MTSAELETLAPAIAAAVKAAVDRATAPLVTRILSLESRQLVVGPAGERGLTGEPGTPGLKGDPGAPGVSGERGEKGEPGVPGAAGERGPEGPTGRDGRDGLPGKDGSSGRDGAPGEKGLDGRDGKDGVDGLGFDDLEAEFDGDRTLTLRFAKGERVKTVDCRLAVPLYRGVFEEGQSYVKGDVVTYAGSAWIAKAPTTAKPGLAEESSRAWQLAVKAGRDGREGKPGERGDVGPKGEKGEPGRHG